MLEPVDDACPKVARDLVDHLAAEVSADRVAAERQRQARLLHPPSAEVGPEMEPAVGIRELPFVNEQAHIDVARMDRVLDAVERQDHGRYLALIQHEGEIGGGELSRHPDPQAADRRAGLPRTWASRYQPGTVAVPHRGAR